MSHVYVFALPGRRASPFTVQGHRIQFIEVDPVFVAVERRATAPALSERELRMQHAIVTAIFRRVEDLLPVRFGTWMDRHELSEVVAARKAAILDALDLVRGRVQMTLRFSSDVSQSPEQQSAARRSESGTAYLEARRAVNRDLPRSIGEVREAVGDLVVAERIGRGSEVLAGAVYHLISRVDVRRYRSVTRSFHSPVLTVTGPWPPFAFAPEPWP
jgi:hypothetical protein